MSDKLKKFVNEHRREFDTDEPGKQLWEKMDARLELKNPSRISSKWLSKLKYLGFSASVLVIAVYFISKSLTDSSTNGLALNKKDSILLHSEQNLIAYQNNSDLNAGGHTATIEVNDLSDRKSQISSSHTEQHIQPIHYTDSVSNKKSEETRSSCQEKNKSEDSAAPLSKEAEGTKTSSANEKKENDLMGNNKKKKLYIPEEPEKMNSYTGTLYEGSSFRSVLRAFKFPGRVNLDKGGGIRAGNTDFRTTVKTISCGRLENMKNMKAVWLKGRTDKELILSVGKKFKNIVLVKPDGRELHPEAISHYYPGLGIISDYKGRYFKMIFKDKVELILFFKNAEEGDRIVIDGILEAVVKNKS